MSTEDFIVIDTNTPTQIKEQTFEPLPVYVDGHPFLKMPTKVVEPSEIKTPEFQQVIGRLKATMRQYDAVGLSANQCGINLRVFVLGSDVFQMACINPKIIDFKNDPEDWSGPVLMREGCVSFPGMFLNVPRYKSIQVEYLNENGVSTTAWLDGITAQCYQHELDHMDGICYTDKVGPLSVKMARQRQQKLIKKIKRSMK
jgi:peptide deformylase